MKPMLYQDVRGTWRWRLVARNGLTVADCAEGYATRSGAKQALRRVAMAFTMLVDGGEL